MTYDFSKDVRLEMTTDDNGQLIRPTSDDKEFIVGAEGRGTDIRVLQRVILPEADEFIVIRKGHGSLTFYQAEKSEENFMKTIKDVLDYEFGSDVMAVLFKDRGKQRCWVPRDRFDTEFGDIYTEQDKSETDDWSRETGQIYSEVRIPIRW